MLRRRLTTAPLIKEAAIAIREILKERSAEHAMCLFELRIVSNVLWTSSARLC
jgi:hypothetical protein